VIVALVAAIARGGVIGRDGGLPWHLPEDMAHFREVTLGHPVVMGRRTWESLPHRFRPLPGRRNVVVTRNPQWSAEGAERAASLAEALELLGGEARVSVIGGGELFSEALPLADELVLTELDLEVDGDTFFPHWDREAFVEASREERIAADGTPIAFVRYVRRDSPEASQLSALASVGAALEREGVVYWLFGGWAVDFYAGRVTRRHDDIDITVWRHDLGRITAALEEAGWRHAPDPDEDGGTGYERGGVRLELTYLARKDGTVGTPLRDGFAPWPGDAFGDDERELRGTRARLLSFEALTSSKASPRAEATEAAKDAADFDVLSGLRGGR
jgi:dihydrofolate reductase